MSYLVSYAGSDNYNAGYVCGVTWSRKCPDGGDIIVLDSPTMHVRRGTAPTASSRRSKELAPR